MAMHIRLMNERRDQIVSVVNERERITVSELSEMLNVSSVTIRGDLNFLDNEGRIARVHGGAAAVKPGMKQEVTFAARQRHRATEKHALAKLAATLVEPTDSIFLDSSTTALAVGLAIKASTNITNVTVLTTSIWTAIAIMEASHIHTVVTGGSLGGNSGALNGPIAREILSKYNFNKAFVGALGLTADDGLTDNDPLEAELKQTIVKNAKEVIAVLDGTKFGQVGLASYAQIDQLTHLVTEESAPSDTIQILRENNVKVLVATLD